jgi:hypothetical protein
VHWVTTPRPTSSRSAGNAIEFCTAARTAIIRDVLSKEAFLREAVTLDFLRGKVNITEASRRIREANASGKFEARFLSPMDYASATDERSSSRNEGFQLQKCGSPQRNTIFLWPEISKLSEISNLLRFLSTNRRLVFRYPLGIDKDF